MRTLVLFAGVFVALTPYPSESASCQQCYRGLCFGGYSSGYFFCVDAASADSPCKMSTACISGETDPGNDGDWLWVDPTDDPPDDPPPGNEYSLPVSVVSLGALGRLHIAQISEKSAQAGGCGAAPDAYAVDADARALAAIADRLPRHAEDLLSTVLLSKATGHFGDSGEMVVARQLDPTELHQAIIEQRMPLQTGPIWGGELRLTQTASMSSSGELVLRIQPTSGDIVAAGSSAEILTTVFKRSGTQALPDGGAVPKYVLSRWKVSDQPSASANNLR